MRTENTWMLRSGEVAKRLGLHPLTVRRWVIDRQKRCRADRAGSPHPHHGSGVAPGGTAGGAAGAGLPSDVIRSVNSLRIELVADALLPL